jgi:small basic protein
VRFFRLSIFSLLRLSLFISEFLANLLLAIFAKAILSLFGAVIAQFGRQFDENVKLIQYGYCFFNIGVV